MESDESEEDTRGVENRKRRKNSVSSDGSRTKRTVEKYQVGMIAVTRSDGIFKDSHKVGRFVGKKLGDVRSIKITRSGMVIIDCVSRRQKEQALRITVYEDHSVVKCFPLGTEYKKKGVISGVPLSVEDEEFRAIEGVCEARRLTKFRQGEREQSSSVCLTFVGELPERIYLDYICYRVRKYERAPLRCFCCQEYGHVAAVCKGVRRCGRCGKNTCEGGTCEEEQVKCIHCSGNHHVGSMECPEKIKQVKVSKIREEEGLTYAEATKRLERKERAVVQTEQELEKKGEDQKNVICMDKKRFLAFIAMVVNCAVEIKGKSERIKMVLDAARRFLDIMDISGEELDNTLREKFMPFQTIESDI